MQESWKFLANIFVTADNFSPIDMCSLVSTLKKCFVHARQGLCRVYSRGVFTNEAWLIGGDARFLLHPYEFHRVVFPIWAERRDKIGTTKSKLKCASIGVERTSRTVQVAVCAVWK